MAEAIRRYETDLEPIHATYRVEVGDGPPRWVEAFVKPLLDADRRHVGSVGVTRDVTDERRLLHQSAESQKLEAVGLLAARTAHDFNNLLAVMLMATDLLADEVTSADGIASLESISQSIEQARQVTDQLLLLSRRRIASGRLSRVDEQLQRLAPLLSHTLGEGIDLVVETDAADCVVGLDSGRFDQVVLNLATNGRDAMGGYGRLEIRTERPSSEEVVLTVADHGDGMSPEILAQAFDTFFTTKEEGRGSGLGLTTVRDTVQLVNGTIDIASEVGEGTRVTVTLPTLDATLPVAAAERADEVDLRGDADLYLVEDQDALRQSLAIALALNGYRVRTARRIEDALSDLASRPCELLVTDLMLPDGVGSELVRKLRRRLPDLPVVFISGFAGVAADQLEEIPDRCLFLGKPFAAADLLLAIRELLPPT